MKENFRVAVKGFIVKDGKVLVLKRRTNDAHKPGAWDIPGGRLELGEDPLEGLKREVREETGLEVEPQIPLDVHHFVRDDGQTITMIIFLCSLKEGEVQLSEEHTEFSWVEMSATEKIPEWLSGVVGNVEKYGLLRL